MTGAFDVSPGRNTWPLLSKPSPPFSILDQTHWEIGGKHKLTIFVVLLLIVATAIGLITGWWWHLSVARKHENKLKLQLKVRNRQLRKWVPDFDSTKQDQSLESGSTNSIVHTVTVYQNENERLNSEIARYQAESEKLRVELTSADQELEQELENSTSALSQVEYWQEAFESLQAQQSQWEVEKLTMDRQIAGYEQQQAHFVEQVHGLEDDLVNAQRKLRDSQKQSEIFQAEREALNQRYANVDDMLNRSLIVALPETKVTEPEDSECVNELAAQTGTASRSAPRRIKALETIAHNQRAKIKLLREVVADMQSVLQFDLPQSIRTGQEVVPLAANDSTNVEQIGLIKENT